MQLNPTVNFKWVESHFSVTKKITKTTTKQHFQWEQIDFLLHWWHAESINCGAIIYQLPFDLWTDVVIYLIVGLITATEQ